MSLYRKNALIMANYAGILGDLHEKFARHKLYGTPLDTVEIMKQIEECLDFDVNVTDKELKEWYPQENCFNGNHPRDVNGTCEIDGGTSKTD